MTERDAFIRAILSDPDEDAHRLVYADWLTENGDDVRGGFIRVQCELALREASPLDSPCTCLATEESFRRYQAGVACEACRCRQKTINALRARGRELFDPRGPDQLKWLGAAHALTVPGSDWADHLSWFRRGFVHSVTCRGDSWVRHGDAVLAEHPVREVVATEPADYAGDSYSGALWLTADPEERMFRAPAVREAVAASHGSWIAALDAGTVALALLRLRWPGVTFRYAG